MRKAINTKADDFKSLISIKILQSNEKQISDFC